MFKIGQEIMCVITEIDKEKRRVAISHRLTKTNPFEITKVIVVDGSLASRGVKGIDCKGAWSINVSSKDWCALATKNLSFFFKFSIPEKVTLTPNINLNKNILNYNLFLKIFYIVITI